MRTHLTDHDIANNVRMIRTQHAGTIVLVEGTTDARVFNRFVNETLCKLIPAAGKEKVISAIEMLEMDDFKGLMAIVDADFWTIEAIEPDSPNIMITDFHDIECMLLSSDAFEHVLSEFGSKNEIEKLGKPVQELLLQSGLPIGFLRWLSSPSGDNLSLKFKDITFENFICKKTLSIDIDYLINEVKINSKDHSLNNGVIKSKILSLMSGEYDPWHVCSGHDLIRILSIGLRNIFGNIRANNITYETVDGILRLAYDYSFFSLTKLHKSIKNWENVNSPYKVLND